MLTLEFFENRDVVSKLEPTPSAHGGDLSENIGFRVLPSTEVLESFWNLHQSTGNKIPHLPSAAEHFLARFGLRDSKI